PAPLGRAGHGAGWPDGTTISSASRAQSWVSAWRGCPEASPGLVVGGPRWPGGASAGWCDRLCPDGASARLCPDGASVPSAHCPAGLLRSAVGANWAAWRARPRSGEATTCQDARNLSCDLTWRLSDVEPAVAQREDAVRGSGVVSAGVPPP